MSEELSKLDTVTDSSGANAQDARIQVNVVTDAVNYLTRKADDPLISAKEFENVAERLSRKTDAMRTGIVSESTQMPKIIKVSADSELKNMNAKYNRFFANTDVFATRRIGDNQ